VPDGSRDAVNGPATAMRWWGWGDPEHPSALPPHAGAFLREALGETGLPRPPVALEHVELKPAALPAPAAGALRAILGAERLRDDHAARVLHAAGKGYPDLVRMRAGTPDGAPDAVAWPRTGEELGAVLQECARSSVAVVPFGGGTSVVGGVAPLAAEHAAVLSLDMAEMGDLLALDRESATVKVQGGARAAAVERRLGELGYTLGHFPQSFEYVTLGGCAATRSAGQASSGYGAIEKMVLGLRLVAPSGEIELPATPATAAGPGLRQLLVGSEGTLGVISEVSLRVRPAPRERVYEGLFFEHFDAGVDALRLLAAEHVVPDVVRLSDEAETRMSMALAGDGGLKGRIGRAYLGLRGYADGCITILGFEGGPEDVAFRRGRAAALCHGAGAISVGRSPGEAWRRGRFEAPYLRDDLLTQGVLVETLETATPWANVLHLHAAVGDAIADALTAQGTPGMVMCHVSHVYETGASLYFTFIARQREGEEVAQWQAVKAAACEAIVNEGGTITHHHAVGVDHEPYMPREIGADGLRALRAVKAELDPAGIMNPGKLLDAGA